MTTPRSYSVLFWLLALVLLALFVGFRDLPMVDLPQHASQISLWLGFDNPFEGDAVFTPNFRTPYLVTYAIARLLAPGLDVRPIVFERDSIAFPGVPAFLHFPVYYQVEKGGHQGFLFATYPSSVIRFREPRRLPCMPLGAEWNPAAFDPRREAADYDYFLERSDVDRSRQLFESSPERIELELRVGPWWAYRRAGAIAGHF